MKIMNLYMLLMLPFILAFFSAGLRAENSSTGTVKQGWIKQDDKLVLYGVNGSMLKEFHFEKKEETLATHPDAKFTEKSFLTVTGDASKNGKYAWLDRRAWKWLLGGGWADYDFQYYGESGQLLWEKKNSVIGVTLSNDGEIVFLLEADPKWVAKNEHGNSYYFPVIHDDSGAVIEKIEDCGTYDSMWGLSKNGRYATVGCSSLKDSKKTFQVIFDVKKRKKYVKSGGIDINSIKDDGSYKIRQTKQEKNPKTGKYGDFKTSEIGEGKLE